MMMKNNRERYIEELMHSFEVRYNRARSNYQDSGSESAYNTMCKYEELITVLDQWQRNQKLIASLAARIKNIPQDRLRSCPSEILEILNTLTRAGE